MAAAPASPLNVCTAHPPGAPPPPYRPAWSLDASSPQQCVPVCQPPDNGYATDAPLALRATLPNRSAPSSTPDTSSSCSARGRLVLAHTTARTPCVPREKVPVIA